MNFTGIPSEITTYRNFKTSIKIMKQCLRKDFELGIANIIINMVQSMEEYDEFKGIVETAVDRYIDPVAKPLGRTLSVRQEEKKEKMKGRKEMYIQKIIDQQDFLDEKNIWVLISRNSNLKIDTIKQYSEKINWNTFFRYNSYHVRYNDLLLKKYKSIVLYSKKIFKDDDDNLKGVIIDQNGYKVYQPCENVEDKSLIGKKRTFSEMIEYIDENSKRVYDFMIFDENDSIGIFQPPHFLEYIIERYFS